MARLDVSELVQTHAVMDGTTQSSSSTTTYSHLPSGCIGGSRTTHLIMHAIDDSDYVPLPAAAKGPYGTRPWPKSHPLDAQEASSSGPRGRSRAASRNGRLGAAFKITYVFLAPFFPSMAVISVQASLKVPWVVMRESAISSRRKARIEEASSRHVMTVPLAHWSSSPGDPEDEISATPW